MRITLRLILIVWMLYILYKLGQYDFVVSYAQEDFNFNENNYYGGKKYTDWALTHNETLWVISDEYTFYSGKKYTDWSLCDNVEPPGEFLKLVIAILEMDRYQFLRCCVASFFIGILCGYFGIIK